MTALLEAVRIVDEIRAARLLAGDADTAERLAELRRHLSNEAEFVDGVERLGLPLTDRSFPAGAAIGWVMRNDAHIRALRELRGLSIPKGCDGRDAE